MHKIRRPITLCFFVFVSNLSLSQVAAVEASYRCEENVSYGSTQSENYLRIKLDGRERTFFFEQVAVYRTGNGSHLVVFPYFGLAPQSSDDNEDPVALLKQIPGKDLRFRLSQFSILIPSGESSEYDFPQTSFSTIGCVLDMNQNDRSLEMLLSQNYASMTHELSINGSGVDISFQSQMKDNPSNSLSVQVSTVLTSDSKLQSNFQPEQVGNRLSTRIIHYPSAGFITYMKRYGSVQTVPLPESGSNVSAYFSENYARVYKFNELNEDKISFETHKVTFFNEKEDAYIKEPIQSGEKSAEDFALNEETLQLVVESAQLLNVQGDPLLISQEELPEGERGIGFPITVDRGRDIGLQDLPESQKMSFQRKFDPYNYSLVDRRLDGLQLSLQAINSGYEISLEKTNLNELARSFRLDQLRDMAGKNWQDLQQFVVYVSENSQEVRDKSIDWWEQQARKLGVKPVKSELAQDYFAAIEDKYDLNNTTRQLVLSDYYSEEYESLIGIFEELADISYYNEDTASYSTTLLELTEKIDINLSQRTDWYQMKDELLEKIRDRYSYDIIRDAEEKAQNKTRVQPAFKAEITSTGQPVASRFTWPDGTKAIKIEENFSGDDIDISLSHPDQDRDSRSFEIGGGIHNLQSLIPLIPALDITESFDQTFYFIGYQGTQYGGQFIKPIFYQADMVVTGSEKVSFVDETIDCYLLEVSFNTPLVRPNLIPKPYKTNSSTEANLKVWVSQKSGNEIVKLDNGQRVFWKSPEKGSDSTGVWLDWIRSR